MATFLFYTSPARGHLFPVMGVGLELKARGHNVHIRTLSQEVEMVRSLGLSCEPIAKEVENRELDDWRGKNPLQALNLAMKTFGDRAFHETGDLKSAIEQTGADVLFVDINSWGAQAAAESSGLPWAVFQPYFTPLPAPGVPPFGPGLRRSTSPLGRIRDGILRKLLFSKMNGPALPAINRVRQGFNLESLSCMTELLHRPPRVFYFTTEAFDYPRDSWPENFRFTGPATWGPHVDTPEWLSKVKRPVALATCSTERQNDRGIIEAALKSLPSLGLYVAASSASYSPDEFQVENEEFGRVEQYMPHGPVLDRASVAVCHGGMGITQRSLSKGVPVVVVPYGRDQLEVARRVEYARAGVRLMPHRLNPESLSKAVSKALEMKKGAQNIAASFSAAGGDPAVADGLEALLNEYRAEAV